MKSDDNIKEELALRLCDIFESELIDIEVLLQIIGKESNEDENVQ